MAQNSLKVVQLVSPGVIQHDREKHKHTFFFFLKTIHRYVMLLTDPFHSDISSWLLTPCSFAYHMTTMFGQQHKAKTVLQNRRY